MQFEPITSASFEDNGYEHIPERMRFGMTAYVNQGLVPGHFLTAIICNDLKETVARADYENETLISLYVRWFYNVAPAPCWGSPAKMQTWINERRETL